MKIRPFDPNPSSGYCKIPNILFDVIMPTCTGNEFQVLCFIYRKTIGFHKAEDQLCYSDIANGTSAKGRGAISKAIKGLLEKKYIVRRGERRGLMWYGVNQGLEINITSSSDLELDEGKTSAETELDDQSGEANLVPKQNYASSETELDQANLVLKRNTPKDSSLKTSFKDSSSTTGPTTFDIDLADCLTLYRNNIGNLSQLQVDDFQDVHGGLSPPPAETKYQWFQYAVLEAASNGVNNWKYCKAILEKVNRAGSLQAHKDGRNGQNGQAISSRFSESENSSSQKAKRGSSTRRQVRRRPDVGRGQTPEMRAKLREAFGQ